MGNKQSQVDLPSDAPGASGQTPGRSPDGGALFKFADDAYALLTPAVVPELYNEGDDDAPQWVLDVRGVVVSDEYPRGDRT